MGKVPKLTLMIRHKANEKWRHVQPEKSANGRVKTLPVGGSFNLRYKKNGEDKWDPVEGGADAAMAAMKRRELCLQAEAAGIIILELNTGKTKCRTLPRKASPLHGAFVTK